MALEKNNVVVVEHVFAAPAQKVFAALKEGRLFFNCGAWPTKTTIDFKVGGKYRLDFAQYGFTHGEFTEIVAGMNLFANMGATAANSKVDFRVGGKYSLNLEKGTLNGEFLEIVKNERIVMTWDGVPCGGKLEKPTRVTMEFGPYGDGGQNSYLELTHEGFTKDEPTLLHHGGWNGVFEKIRLRAAK